eukprot:jgi/Mesen1/3195/ME000185S02336
MRREDKLEGLRSKWKNDLPVLYDWFVNHHTLWPSLSCRWGPIIEESTHYTKQQLYLSEQTDGSVPNTLLVAEAVVPRPRVAAPEHMGDVSDDEESDFITTLKAINHPGEVNRIREMSEDKHIVATHTDSQDVLVWNTRTQPDRRGEDGSSRPDLVLTGHTQNAEFALATSPAGHQVLSGGRDHLVVLWDLADHATSLLVQQEETVDGGSSSRVQARGLYRGHTATVEDVQFCPVSAPEFCSVADDACLMLWDTRSGPAPVTIVERAHGPQQDVQCVDWSALAPHLLLSGAADGTVNLFDRRRMSSKGPCMPVHTFSLHTAPVVCVQWCPHQAGVFASCGDDGILSVWDVNHVTTTTSATSHQLAKSGAESAAGLLLQHVGHRSAIFHTILPAATRLFLAKGDKVAEFQWSPSSADAWALVSSCVETKRSGGGSVQLWRMSPLTYLPQDDAHAQTTAWLKALEEKPQHAFMTGHKRQAQHDPH